MEHALTSKNVAAAQDRLICFALPSELGDTAANSRVPVLVFDSYLGYSQKNRMRPALSLARTIRKKHARF